MQCPGGFYQVGPLAMQSGYARGDLTRPAPHAQVKTWIFFNTNQCRQYCPGGFYQLNDQTCRL
jgi:hypothetical protein